ncbi:hypothetical protein KM481_gp46 [Harp seal herpesvirus]|uniref:Uncharacterized protein n=1 Tax=phocid gammaherpesvirus 3 TaxID=2560643 RepID=A0A0R5Z2N7_9GAMA|nr:hypothetical protein KM481_gp46 [Harp seal herpesvirus]AJG42976.1 hypothetical protein [Harp seal herpesvirus]
MFLCVLKMKLKQYSFNTGFITFCSLLISVFCLILAINSIFKMKNVVEVGSFIITDHIEFKSQAAAISHWEMFNFTKENKTFTPMYYYQKYVNINLNVTELLPRCQNCSKSNANFHTNNTCYYLTSKKYTFKDCFTTCINASNCYYFIGNFFNMPELRIHINASATYWIGAYRDVQHNNWRDLNGTAIEVYDVYGTTCAYIGKHTPIPRSDFNCNHLRFCVCGGYFFKKK